MMHEYELQRYAAYFRGWCQTFGEHDSIPNENTGICWLLSEHQAGFVLQPQLARSLYREVLRKNYTPVLENCSNPCLFMTSHFTYGTGTRILTLSNKKPLSIIYKKIGCIRIWLD